MSQTPFGCWSDQDKTIKSTMRNDDREPSQTPFGCWSDQDIVADPDNWVTEYLKSQTPFGCWSDQDEHRTGGNRAPGARHKRLSAVGPIRTCTMEQLCKLLTQLSHKRLSAVGPIRTRRRSVVNHHPGRVTNAFRLLVRSGPPSRCWKRPSNPSVTNAFRLLVRSGPSHGKASNHRRYNVTNAFRLLVRSGRTRKAKVMTDADRSQTPFGCWSDQDTCNHD